MRHPSREGGFSLIEVMAASVIAVIAVLGLSFTFSTGRGMIDRFAVARAALAAAEERLEILAVLAARDLNAPELALGTHPSGGPLPRRLNQNQSGLESWLVEPVDDPLDNANGDLNPVDYRRVTVEIRWTQGSLVDRITLSRIFLAP